MKKNKHKDSWELLLATLEDEVKCIKRLLNKTHKNKDYKECLELKETLFAVKWVLNESKHIYETGGVL